MLILDAKNMIIHTSVIASQNNISLALLTLRL